MSATATFNRSLNRDSMLWVAKWLLFVATIAIGWLTKSLTTTSVIAIAVFVIWQGVLPYARFAWSLAGDIATCALDKASLQLLTQPSLLLQATSSSSLSRLLKALLKQRDPRRRVVALTEFISVARHHWEALLEPVASAAGMAPMVGLGGSLLGLFEALRELAIGGLQNGPASLLAAMGTMVMTTLAGCAGALLLIGLAELGRVALNTHLAELEMWGGQFLDESPKDHNLDQLFDIEG